jgi:hypothetical protein
MECCAWLAEAGLGDCVCEPVPPGERQQVPQPFSPTPSGRDLTPGAVWTELLPSFSGSGPSATEVASLRQPEYDEQKAPLPHVRLTVLFCCFLT